MLQLVLSGPQRATMNGDEDCVCEKDEIWLRDLSLGVHLTTHSSTSYIWGLTAFAESSATRPSHTVSVAPPQAALVMDTVQFPSPGENFKPRA